MPSQNYSVTSAEIDRDHRMLVLALLRRLMAISTDQITHALAGGRIGDPLDVCQALEGLVSTSRAQYRRLNNARIHRRGRRSPDLPPDPRTPSDLRRFTRNGPYAGCYSDLRSLARDLLPSDALPPRLERYLDLDALAIDLHLDGALWTLDHDGKIHAFRCPREDQAPSTGDLAPASPPEPAKKPRRRNRRRRSPTG